MILFDETIRQAADDGAPFPEVLEKAGVIRDQGRHRCAPARALRGRDGDGGPRRTARPAGRVRRVRRAVRQVARHVLRGAATPSDFAVLANGHAMARYAASPGGRHRPDRGARNPDGRRSRPRRVRGGDREGARRPVRPAPRPPRRPGRHAAQGEYGGAGQGRATQDDDATIAEATLRTLRDHVPRRSRASSSYRAG